MAHLCKDPEKAERDAAKATERKAEGKTTYTCKKCSRPSHKEGHLCKPKEVNNSKDSDEPKA